MQEHPPIYLSLRQQAQFENRRQWQRIFPNERKRNHPDAWSESYSLANEQALLVHIARDELQLHSKTLRESLPYCDTKPK